MGRTWRANVLVASALSGVLLLASCSGGDAPEDEPAAASSSASESPSSDAASDAASASESPSAEPTPTAKPLSRFEGDPAVRGARAWAAATARAINAGQADLGRAKPFMTANGASVVPPLAKDEIGLKYPGPVPFTPTDVSRNGSSATVYLCFWSAGFGLDRKTGQPAAARKIVPMQFAMVRQGGTWKLDAIYSAESSCARVPVKGVGF